MRIGKQTASTGQPPPARVVGAWNWDIQRNLFYCGAELADYFAVNASRAARGAPIEEFLAAIHPDDVTRVSAAIRDAIATDGRFSQSCRLATRSFGERVVRATGLPHRDPAGRPAFFIGFMTDIGGQEVDLPVDLLADIGLLRDRVSALKSRLVSYLFQALQDEVECLRERRR